LLFESIEEDELVTMTEVEETIMSVRFDFPDLSGNLTRVK
jgi:hypothetical protein